MNTTDLHGIPNIVLKTSAIKLIPVLLHLFRRSFQSGIAQTVHKKGEKFYPEIIDIFSGIQHFHSFGEVY